MPKTQVVDRWQRAARRANAEVGTDLHADAFFALLRERVARLG